MSSETGTPALDRSTMLATDRQHAESIDSVSRALAEWTVTLLFERHPELERRMGGARALWKGEIMNRLHHMAEAIAADRPALFVQSVEWARAAFIAREMDPAHLSASLIALEETLRSELPAELSGRASAIIDESLDALERAEAADVESMFDSVLEHEGVDTVRARAYLVHLLERHQARAVDVLLDAVNSGRTVAQVYETVVAPALGEVGRLWQIQEATVADEHYVTTATQGALAVLRTRLPQAPRNGKRALAASVGGDLHDVGIRMVADLLESEGWQVDCLGANMPTVDLVEHAVDDFGTPQFDLVALSASTGLTVRSIAKAIEALREAAPDRHIPIMVGGGAFRVVPDLWKVVGADGCACCATDAVRVAAELAKA